jgi:hypothetical protein
MKTLPLIAIAISICLTGCNKQVDKTQVSESATKTEPTKVASKVLPAENVPDGRWIHNPLHCQDELPIIGPYDFEVASNSIKFIGITDKGTWYEDNNAEATAAFTDFLAENEPCLNAQIGNFKLMRFEGASYQYTLAYAGNEKLMLRLKGDKVQLIVPFDIESIKKLQIIDNSDTGVTDDESQG